MWVSFRLGAEALLMLRVAILIFAFFFGSGVTLCSIGMVVLLGGVLLPPAAFGGACRLLAMSAMGALEGGRGIFGCEWGLILAFRRILIYLHIVWFLFRFC